MRGDLVGVLKNIHYSININHPSNFVTKHYKLILRIYDLDHGSPYIYGALMVAININQFSKNYTKIYKINE